MLNFNVTNEEWENEKEEIHTQLNNPYMKHRKIIYGVIRHIRLNISEMDIILLTSGTNMNIYKRIIVRHVDKHYILKKLKPGMGVCFEVDRENGSPNECYTLMQVKKASTKLPFKIMYCSNDSCNANILEENATFIKDGKVCMQCLCCGNKAIRVDRILMDV